MSEDNKPSDATIKREDYDKIIVSHNSLKAEKERIEKELNELKDTEKTNKVIEEEKKKWEQEKAELLKTQDELKQKAMESKTVAKGVVNQKEEKPDNFNSKLNKIIPEPKVDVNRIPSALGRLRHFKSPMTRQFTKQELGMGLNIHATAQRVNPSLVPNEARVSSKDDINLRKI